MELKFDKNNQLKVRLAIVESQLKLANIQIKTLKYNDFGSQSKFLIIK